MKKSNTKFIIELRFVGKPEDAWRLPAVQKKLMELGREPASTETPATVTASASNERVSKKKGGKR